MVRTYETAGRMAQACSHRIAIAALQPKLAVSSGEAIRCLRALGRERDAALVARSMVDDASRAAAEKAATVAPIAPKANGDLVEACETCHKQFKPDIPTGELFMHRGPEAAT